jgi:hypothetical protein
VVGGLEELVADHNFAAKHIGPLDLERHEVVAHELGRGVVGAQALSSSSKIVPDVTCRRQSRSPGSRRSGLAGHPVGELGIGQVHRGRPSSRVSATPLPWRPCCK